MWHCITINEKLAFIEKLSLKKYNTFLLWKTLKPIFRDQKDKTFICWGRKGFFKPKQTSKEKNQSACAEKFCHTSLISGAPSSAEFIRLVRQAHNTPWGDMCRGRYMQLGVSNPPEVSCVSWEPYAYFGAIRTLYFVLSLLDRTFPVFENNFQYIRIKNDLNSENT